MIKKFVECTSSRKKTVFVAQSNGSDAAKIDSYFKDPERLAASVQSFVSSIETGCAIDDIAAASQYLSALLNCTVTLESTEDNNDGAIFSNLATEPEASVQGKLRENWIMSPSHFDICVLDTHDSNFKAPIFKLSDKDAPDSGLLNTAKPDLTSLAAPMFLEIKDVSSTHGRRYSQGAVMMENEYDVLNQAINRIHVTD